MIENAKWIWVDAVTDLNQYVDFVLDFNITDVDKEAIMQISSDSEYVLLINGDFMCCGQYNDYPDNKTYDTVVVGNLLQKGINRICITGYYQGESSMQYSIGESGICFALKNFNTIFYSDESVLSALSLPYHSGKFYKTTSQLGFGFLYDSELEDDWKQTEGILGDRFKHSIIKNIKTQLHPRPIRKLMIGEKIPVRVLAQGYFLRKEKNSLASQIMYHDFLSHRKFNEIFEGASQLPGEFSLKKPETDGVYLIIDLDKEESGYITMDFFANKGATFDIGYGEHLDDLRVRTVIDDRNFANTYICKEGNQQFTYYFRRIAGRYIEIHISLCKELIIRYIGLTPTYYPLEKNGVFWCNDHLHNKIYKTCIETLQKCMHEHYEDCPWREQALYSSDSRNQALCGYYAFGKFDFARASIDLLGNGLCDDGYIRICAPTDSPLKIPSFSMLWLLEVKEYTEFSGDDYFVKTAWDKIEKMLDTYTKSLNDGLVRHPIGENYWNFYEWSEGYNGIESFANLRNNDDFCDGVYQMFVYLAIISALWLGEKYGKESFCSHYGIILQQMNETINDKFWNKGRQLYASYINNGVKMHYGELAQALAIYTGIADGSKVETLCNTLCGNAEITGITLGYSIFKYEALLMQNGKYNRYVFDEIAGKWGKMLFSGATTFWETEIGASDFDDAGSLCHGWSASPLYLYFRYILGITAENIRGESSNVIPCNNVFCEYSGKVMTKNGICCVKKTEGKMPIVAY